MGSRTMKISNFYEGCHRELVAKCFLVLNCPQIHAMNIFLKIYAWCWNDSRVIDVCWNVIFAGKSSLVVDERSATPFLAFYIY